MARMVVDKTFCFKIPFKSRPNIRICAWDLRPNIRICAWDLFSKDKKKLNYNCSSTFIPQNRITCAFLIIELRI